MELPVLITIIVVFLLTVAIYRMFFTRDAVINRRIRQAERVVSDDVLRTPEPVGRHLLAGTPDRSRSGAVLGWAFGLATKPKQDRPPKSSPPSPNG